MTSLPTQTDELSVPLVSCCVSLYHRFRLDRQVLITEVGTIGEKIISWPCISAGCVHVVHLVLRTVG